MPPLSTIVSPVMYDDSSEAKKDTALAQSSGEPSLLGASTKPYCKGDQKLSV